MNTRGNAQVRLRGSPRGREIVADERRNRDLNTRRGRVMGTESERGRTVVIAQVPLAEMLRYTTTLRSMTGGRGVFTMEFDRYEIVPAYLAQEIIDAHQKELEAKKEE